MEENKINIAAILKEKPNARIYDLLHNIYVKLDNISTTDGETVIWCTKKYPDKTSYFGYSELGTERGWLDGLQVLKPSKEMQDWSKFAWKKGDVLDSNDGFRTCLFDGWKDDTYTQFFGKYVYCPAQRDEEDVWQFRIRYDTADYYKSNAPESFIELLEKHEGGKLNLETLTIERDVAKGLIGEFCYFEIKGLCIVSMLEKINEDTFELGDCVSWKDGEPSKKEYSIKFDEPVKKGDLPVIGRATKEEIFEYMVTKGRHTLKTFDKVLVRDGDNDKWFPAFFLKMNENNESYPYFCKAMDIESALSYKQCVPYKGCEHLAFTKDPF